MGDSDTRQALNDLATEECSFEEDGPLHLVPGGPPDRFERCLDHTLGWVKAMISTPPGFRSGATVRATPARQPDRNREETNHKALVFVTGVPNEVKWRHSDQASIRSVERSLGLRACTHVSLTAVRASVPECGYDLAATLDQVASDLPQNSAVMVRIRVSAQSHLIAMYKSRFGTTHFFDANIGIFKLDWGIIDWFDVWTFWYASTCSAYVQPQMEPGDRSSWYTVYR